MKRGTMTREQINDIREKLKVWREERGITVASQRDGFFDNFREEEDEYFTASNDLERIDALCDMCVLIFNAEYEDFQESKFRLADVVSKIKKLKFNPYLCLLETIKEISSRTGSWNAEKNKWIKEQGAYTIQELEERLKTKFIEEDKNYWYWNVYKFKKWYKADYLKCKERR